jgi:hypothetical protein
VRHAGAELAGLPHSRIRLTVAIKKECRAAPAGERRQPQQEK